MVGWRGDGVLGHISYTGDQQPVSGEQNPWLAYQDIMGLSGLDDTEEQTKNDTDAPHNKLLTTILNAVGVEAEGGGPVTSFGGQFGEPGEFDQLKA